VATNVVRTVSGITVSIARDPALVRTVRLVAAAVARRASHDEEFVEEVRLAVGEACALMVAADVTSAEPVSIRLSADDRLRVEVSSSTPVREEVGIDGVEPWALLRGLIEDFAIDQDGSTTTLSMSWPLG
jgi:hypothetical protein